MLARFRSYLTFANVTALTALFVALSGGAYALTIPRNSVGPKQLKRNAVTSTKIMRGAVTAAKVRPRSLTARSFKPGQLPTGPPGPPGPVGPEGPKGAQGPPGPTYRALVKRDGTLVGGNATSARKEVGPGIGPGSYSVTFPRSLENCAGAAVPASFPGYDFAAFRVSANMSFDTGPTAYVNFFSTQGTGDGVDTAFSLVVACG